MKKYFSRNTKALLLGIVSWIIIYGIFELYGWITIETGIINYDSTTGINTSSIFVRFALGIQTIFGMSLLIIPCLITGYYSKSNLIINGLMIIIISHILKTFFNINWSVVDFAFDEIFFILSLLPTGIIMPLSVGVVSVMAGKYIKDNKVLITRRSS